MPDTLVAPQLALVAAHRYPLRTRPAALDPDTVGADLPIGTLLAADSTWDWILSHRDTVTAAVEAFSAAVLTHPAAGDLWLTAHVDTDIASGFTLATRGRPAHGLSLIHISEPTRPY